MQFQPAKIFGLLLFACAPLFMLLGVINVFATSSGLAKAVGFFEVLTLGSLAILIGLAVIRYLGVTFNFNQGRGFGAAPPPATGGTAPSRNPDGGFSA